MKKNVLSRKDDIPQLQNCFEKKASTPITKLCVTRGFESESEMWQR